MSTRFCSKKNNKSKKIVEDKKIEAPTANYNVSAEKLTEILEKHCTDINRDQLIKIFTSLQKYEDYSVLDIPKPSKDDVSDEHQTPPPFKEKIVHALFYIPSNKRSEKTGRKMLGKYKYIKIRLAPSSIKAAGIGAYAVDPIPKGARGIYKGISKDEEDTNMYYAWTIKTFDEESGETDYNDESLYYVDAFDLKKSNWTRYVNCGLTDKANNFESDQKFDKIFYVATRDIKPDEELFIDYGEGYRVDNLGMKGKY
jgi:hypothetical protein